MVKSVPVISVHYNSVASYTDRYLQELSEYPDPIHYWRIWHWGLKRYLHTVEKGLEKKAIESKFFKTKFVDNIAPGFYYQFIVTTKQYNCFIEDITNFDFIKYKVYESRQPAVNSNYPDEGPKLIAFLFYVPEEQ